jgi:flagellar biosynthesis anti-sigma factor FlgM
MKVDLNGPDLSSLSELTSTNVTSAQQGQVVSSQVPGSPVEPAIGEDTATLSADRFNPQSLTAKALESSEVRQDKVEALRQAIQNGDYKIEPDKIAEAMIRNSEQR